MEFRVLGPVQVWHADAALFFPRRQQRLILGILAVEANHLVTFERLIDLLWAEHPPTQARAVVQSRTSELRAILGAGQPSGSPRLAALTTQGNGYVLRVDPDLVDAHRFRRLVKSARAAGSDEQAREALRQASQLWRGPALGGWLPRDSHAALCHGLESERTTALEDLFDIELRQGHHHVVVDEILGVFAANPIRERLTAQVMLALHRAARTPEALQAYDRHRRLVGEELGIDPGEALQELHVGILRSDPELSAQRHGLGDGLSQVTAPVSSVAPDGFQVGIPRILPADIPDFTGREKETALLIDLLRHSGDGPRIAVVAGPAGVGKTALCVHAAHQLRDRFPHGQLFADLHGIDREAPPTASEVLARFLRALGVESTLPPTVEERVDLYRDLLADRQVLVVLDNAVDAEQIRPLIPGSVGCAVLINSRARLAGTVSGDPVHLEVLDHTQAVGLLARIAGHQRIGTEPAAAASLARLCGGLPLALRVAAARLVAKPHWTVEHLVHRLGDERQRLDQLSYRELDVRSSIGLSYAGLTVDVQQLLRRLGDIDIPEVNVWCSAALLDSHPVEAEQSLEQLHDAQLIDIAGRDCGGYTRYRLHDLVRLFAKERAVADEPAEELEAARQRAFGAWLFILDEVRQRVIGGRVTLSPAPRTAVDKALLEIITSEPMQWIDTERQAIVDLVRRTARDRRSATCWGIAVSASPLLEIRQLFDEWSSILGMAHAAALETDDFVGQAAIRFRLGTLALDQLDHEAARDHFLRTAALFDRMGDRHGQAVALAYIGMTERFSGNLDAALAGLVDALPALNHAGDHLTAALTLRNIAQLCMERGDQTAAEAYLTDAFAAARLSGSPRAEAQVTFWQGMLRRDQQCHGDAKLLFAQVLDTVRQLGDRGGEAQALRGLGLCHQAEDELDEAATAFAQAMGLVRHPHPTRIEMLLREDLARLAAQRSN